VLVVQNLRATISLRDDTPEEEKNKNCKETKNQLRDCKESEAELNKVLEKRNGRLQDTEECEEENDECLDRLASTQ
jgi:hypothetical protein